MPMFKMPMFKRVVLSGQSLYWDKVSVAPRPLLCCSVPLFN